MKSPLPSGARSLRVPPACAGWPALPARYIPPASRPPAFRPMCD